MPSSLPPAVELISQRLIDEWITRGHTAADQFEGMEVMCAAFWVVLAPMMGMVATRAIFSRAVLLVGRQNARVGSIRVVDGGLDLTRFRLIAEPRDPEGIGEGLSAVIHELLSVLYRLLGTVLVPVLGEVEAELARHSSG